MLTLLIWFNFILHAGADSIDRPEAILAQKVAESTLKNGAKRALMRNFRDSYESKTLEDVVQLRSTRLWMGSNRLEQICDFLAQFGLRLNLTPNDIELYRRKGKLPPVTENSSIALLCLTDATTTVLLRMGISRLKDIRQTSLRDLLREVGMGPGRVREVKSAFERVGFSVYQTREEQVCEEALRNQEPERTKAGP